MVNVSCLDQLAATRRTRTCHCVHVYIQSEFIRVHTRAVLHPCGHRSPVSLVSRRCMSRRRNDGLSSWKNSLTTTTWLDSFAPERVHGKQSRIQGIRKVWHWIRGWDLSLRRFYGCNEPRNPPSDLCELAWTSFCPITVQMFQKRIDKWPSTPAT